MISHITTFPQYPKRNPGCLFVYLSKELSYIIRVVVWKVKGGNLHSVCSARGTEVSVDRSAVSTIQVNGCYSIGNIGKY